MRERQTIISFLIRGFTLLLISAASSWAVDIDMPISASADCLKNNYMSLDLKYHHGPAKCHKTEGIWTGDFLNTSQAEVCRPPEPLSTSIGQCNNTCCYICGGNDETHRNPLNNFAKPAIPGVYRQSISLTSLEEGKSITADVRVVFTPDGLGGLPVCASAQTAVNIPSEGSDSANFIITIPDEGQGPCPASTNINLEGGSDATVLIGGPDVSLLARMTDENGDPLGLSPVTFTISGNSGDTKFADGSASVTVDADGDGRASATLKPGTQSVSFSIQVTGGRKECAGATETFNVTVREPQLKLVVKGLQKQVHFVSHELSKSFSVQVQGEIPSQVISGIDIMFSSDPDGDIVPPKNVQTDPNGDASAVAITGSTPKDYIVKATCASCKNGAGDEVQFIATAISSNLDDPNDPTPPPKLPIAPVAENDGGPPNIHIDLKPFPFQLQYLKTVDLCATITAPDVAEVKRRLTFNSPQMVFKHIPNNPPAANCAASNQVSVAVALHPQKCVETGIFRALLDGSQEVARATGKILIPNNIEFVRAEPPVVSGCFFSPELVFFCRKVADWDILMSGEEGMDLKGLFIVEEKFDRGRVEFEGDTLRFCPGSVPEKPEPKEILESPSRPGKWGVQDLVGIRTPSGSPQIKNCGFTLDQDVFLRTGPDPEKAITGACRFSNKITTRFDNEVDANGFGNIFVERTPPTGP